MSNNETRLPSQPTYQSSGEEEIMDSSSSEFSELLALCYDSESEEVFDPFVSNLLPKALHQSVSQDAANVSSDQRVTGFTNFPEQNNRPESKVTGRAVKQSAIPCGGDIMGTNRESSSQSLPSTSSSELSFESIMRKKLDVAAKETYGSAFLPPHIYAKLSSSFSSPDLTVQSAEPDCGTSTSNPASNVTLRAPSSDRHHQFLDILKEKKLLDSMQKEVEESLCKLEEPGNKEKLLFDLSMSSCSLKLVSPVYTLQAVRDGRPSGAAPDQHPSPPAQPPASKVQFKANDKLWKGTKAPPSTPVPEEPKYPEKPTTSKSIMEKKKADAPKYSSEKGASGAAPDQDPSPPAQPPASKEQFKANDKLWKGTKAPPSTPVPEEPKYSEKATTSKSIMEKKKADAPKYSSEKDASAVTHIKKPDLPDLPAKSMQKAPDSSLLDTSSQTLFNTMSNNETRLPSQPTYQSSGEEEIMYSSSSEFSELLALCYDSESEEVFDPFVSNLLPKALHQSVSQDAANVSSDQRVTGFTNFPEQNNRPESKVTGRAVKQSAIPCGGDIMGTNRESSSQSLPSTSYSELSFESIMRKKLDVAAKETYGSAFLPPHIYAKLSSSFSSPDLTVQSAEPDCGTSTSNPASNVTLRAPSSDRHHQFLDILKEKKLLDSMQKEVEESLCKLGEPGNKEKLLFDLSMSSCSLKLVSPVYTLQAVRDGRPSGAAPDQHPSPPAQPPASKVQFKANDKLWKGTKAPPSTPVPEEPKYPEKPTTSKSIMEKKKADAPKYSSEKGASGAAPDQDPSPPAQPPASKEQFKANDKLWKGTKAPPSTPVPEEPKYSEKATTSKSIMEKKKADAPKYSSEKYASAVTHIKKPDLPDLPAKSMQKAPDSSLLDTSSQTLFNTMSNNETRLPSQPTYQSSGEEEIMYSSSSEFSELLALCYDSESEEVFDPFVSNLLPKALHQSVSQDAANVSSDQRVTGFTNFPEQNNRPESKVTGRAVKQSAIPCGGDIMGTNRESSSQSLPSTSYSELSFESIMRKEPSPPAQPPASKVQFKANDKLWKGTKAPPSTPVPEEPKYPEKPTTSKSIMEKKKADAPKYSSEKGASGAAPDQDPSPPAQPPASKVQFKANDKLWKGTKAPPSTPVPEEPKYPEKPTTSKSIMEKKKADAPKYSSEKDASAVTHIKKPDLPAKSMQKKLDVAAKETYGSALLPPHIYAKLSSSFSSPDLTVQSAEPDCGTSTSNPASNVTLRAPSSDRHHQFLDILKEKKLLDSMQKEVEEYLCKLEEPGNKEKLLFDLSMSSCSLKLVSPVYTLQAVRDGRPSGAAPDQHPSPPAQPPASKVQFKANDKLWKGTKVRPSTPVPEEPKYPEKPTTSKSIMEKKKADAPKYSSEKDASAVTHIKTPGLPGLPAKSMHKVSLPPLIGTKPKWSHHDQSQTRQTSDFPHQVPHPPKSVNYNSSLKQKANLRLYDQSQIKPASDHPHREPHPPKPRQKLPSLENVSCKAPKPAPKNPTIKGLPSIIKKPYNNEDEAVSSRLSHPRKLDSLSSFSSLTSTKSSRASRQHTNEVMENLREKVANKVLNKYKTEKELESKLGFTPTTKSFSGIYNQRLAKFNAENAKSKMPFILEPLTKHEEGCVASHPRWAFTMGESNHRDTSKNSRNKLECSTKSRDGGSSCKQGKTNLFPNVTTTTKMASNNIQVEHHQSKGKNTIPKLPKIK